MGSSCSQVLTKDVHPSSDNRRVSDPVSLSKVRTSVGQDDITKLSPPWQDMLTEAANAELWPVGKPRQERSEWSKYIREAKKIVKLPRMEMSEVGRCWRSFFLSLYIIYFQHIYLGLEPHPGMAHMGAPTGFRHSP